LSCTVAPNGLNSPQSHFLVMLLRLFAKLLWGTTKLTVKYVIVPIAISAAVAAAAGALAERVRDATPHTDGRVDPVIRPER
jgi:hypothetical protein